MIGNDFPGACLTIAKLRMLVNVPAPRHNFALDLHGTAVNFSGRRILRKQQ